MESVEHLIPKLSKKWTAGISVMLGMAIGYTIGFVMGIDWVVGKGMSYLKVEIPRTILMECIRRVGLV